MFKVPYFSIYASHAPWWPYFWRIKFALIILVEGHWPYKKRILGECLLMSSLPGKALRTLVDIARLAGRFSIRSQSRAW